MTEESGRETEKGKGGLIVVLLVVVALGGAAYIWFEGYTNRSPRMTTLVYENEGKTYLYSVVPHNVVEPLLSQGQSPPAMSAFPLYIDEGELYVAPDNLVGFADLLAHNVHLFPHPEKSHDGYAASKSESAYSLTSRVESTETLGSQVIAYEGVLKKGEDEFKVEWEFLPKDDELIAKQGCELRGFWRLEHPMAGTTTLDVRESIVIPVPELERFYGVRIVFDPDLELLRIQRGAPPS